MMTKTVFGIGVYQPGKYPTKENGKPAKIYALWKRMLQRCYSQDFINENPAYAGCSVAETFRMFQEFGDWCKSQIGFNVSGYQLDKDLMLKNNKVYSPETCVFVPRIINVLLTKRSALRGDLPIGVSWYKKYGTFRATLTIDGKPQHIGYFDSPQLAFEAYKTAKENNIRRLADLYKNTIDPRAYAAMMNYSVEITD